MTEVVENGTKSLVVITLASGAKIEEWFTDLTIKSENNEVSEMSYSFQDKDKSFLFIDLSAIKSVMVKKTLPL